MRHHRAERRVAVEERQQRVFRRVERFRAVHPLGLRVVRAGRSQRGLARGRHLHGDAAARAVPAKQLLRGEEAVTGVAAVGEHPIVGRGARELVRGQRDLAGGARGEATVEADAVAHVVEHGDPALRMAPAGRPALVGRRDEGELRGHGRVGGQAHEGAVEGEHAVPVPACDGPRGRVAVDGGQHALAVQLDERGVPELATRGRAGTRRGGCGGRGQRGEKRAHVPLERLDEFLQDEAHDEVERPHALARAEVGVVQVPPQRREQSRDRRGQRCRHEVPAAVRRPGQPARPATALHRRRDSLIQWSRGNAPRPLN
ncbi:MAG: hypothetical protein RLZZ15_1777 [Verrucomicrobiota bacterium]